MIPVQYQQVHPTIQLLDFVESFWMLNNSTDEDIDVIVIPDGRIDVSFSYSAYKPYHRQIDNGADYFKIMIEEGTVMNAPGLPILNKEVMKMA